MRKHRSKRKHYDPDRQVDAQLTSQNQTPPSENNQPKSSDWFVLKYLLAIVLSIGGVFFLLPKIFSNIPNKSISGIAVLLLIPAVRITTDLLIDEGPRPTLRKLIRNYFILLFSLTFQLAMIPLIIMPFVGLMLSAIFGAMGIVVCLFMIGFWLLQNFGYHLGRFIPADEVKIYLMIVVGLSIYEAIFYLGYRWVSSFKRSIFDILADIFLGVTNWLEQKI